VSQDLLPKVDRGDFQEVFIEDLNWLAPDVKKSISVTDDDGRQVSAHNVASYKGLRVWVCDERPGSVLEAELDRLIAKTTTDRLVIFDDEKEQVWRWPVRRAKDGSVTSRLTSHRHKKGDTDPKFAARLDIIRMPFDVILDANAVLGRVREAFDTEAQNESKRASKLMANMYAAVEKAYPATVAPKVRDHEISVTLARILFLMFGDDTEMWHTDAFRNVIQHETLPDGSNLAQVLNDLFTFLDTANPSSVPNGFEGFKYVNGGIFEERIELPPLGKDFRAAILDACAVDWSSISPAIFGSMFQSVRDAATRRALGEHYTSEENILKTLNPLFLDELREELAAALARDTTQKKVNALNKLWDRLGAIRFMDPACGCGNFIIVAYRELRAIELQVMEALYDLRDKHQLSLDAKSDLKVTLDHFYGIEIDEWPARIAETAMFMMDRQCDLKLRERFGQAPERLPIQREATIRVANALLLSWSELLPPTEHVVIAGNPPFLGKTERNAAQTDDMKHAWGADYSGEADFVTSWFAKAADYFGDAQGQWAFVATNSVTQGVVVAPVFGYLHRRGWRIRFAHRTFEWTSDATGAAAVHCVIFGMDRSSVGERRLYNYQTVRSSPVELRPTTINAYLVDAAEIEVRDRRTALAPDLRTDIRFGSMPADGGGLLVSAQEAARVRAEDPIARRHLRRFVGAKELLNSTERWCIWLPNGEPPDVRASTFLSERIERVRDFRTNTAKDAGVRAAARTPSRFSRVQQPDGPYLCIPRHVPESYVHFPAAHFESDVISGDANFVLDDPAGLYFAVVSSGMFMVWQKMVGGRIKNDPRFASTVTWNTFPLPRLSASDRSEIVQAGKAVLEARGLIATMTLAQLYEPGAMTPALHEAHAHLDARVEAVFGIEARRSSSELERQTVLFRHFDQLQGRLV
jgi:hypothetical protein